MVDKLHDVGYSQLPEKAPLLIDYRDSEGPPTARVSTLPLVAVTLAFALLPIVPFWAFTGFLVFLLRTAAPLDFLLYSGLLTFMLVFDVIATIAVLRMFSREWRVRKGHLSPMVAVLLLLAILKAPPHRRLDLDDPYLGFSA